MQNPASPVFSTVFTILWHMERQRLNYRSQASWVTVRLNRIARTLAAFQLNVPMYQNLLTTLPPANLSHTFLLMLNLDIHWQLNWYYSLPVSAEQTQVLILTDQRMQNPRFHVGHIFKHQLSLPSTLLLPFRGNYFIYKLPSRLTENRDLVRHFKGNRPFHVALSGGGNGLGRNVLSEWKVENCVLLRLKRR